MDSNLITRLRTATNQIHKDLESLPVSKAIMSPQLTPADYIDYLQRMLIIHRTIERCVFPVVAQYIADIEMRKKEMLILRDLTALNASHVVADIFSDAAFQNNRAFCMGMLYVSEGSTLGGQYILKNIQKTLAEQVRDATNFLNAYGSHTGSMWKAFTQKLDAYGQTLTDDVMQDAEAGAIYCFERTAFVLSAEALSAE